MIHTIRNGLELQKSDLLVDLGCGGGWILKELKPRAKKVIGLDFSQTMLASAKQFCPDESFICGEIGKLPIKDGSIDCALSYFVFLNFMDDNFVEQALLDVVRILKAGGRALIGQLPDKTRSKDYDREKIAYLEYCQKNFKMGESHREICQAPQKLFDKEKLEQFLQKEKIEYRFKNTFNPFFRPGAEPVIDWRFDLVLKK
jgi:ubiquinone/menaquinone biosynthesis C-methylase UbiE